jgi:hypothetical protein
MPKKVRLERVFVGEKKFIIIVHSAAHFCPLGFYASRHLRKLGIASQ